MSALNTQVADLAQAECIAISTPHYNVLYPEEEREWLPFCLDQGIVVIPWSPLARGRLTREWDSASRRSEIDQFGKRLYQESDRTSSGVSGGQPGRDAQIGWQNVTMLRLEEDSTDEQHIGRRDLTRWPTALGRWLVRAAIALARFTTANAVLVVSSVLGILLVTSLMVASAEVYEAVEAGDGIAGLDRPALNEAISLRTGTSMRVGTFFTHLGGPLWMTVIAAALTLAMTLRWRSRTPLTLMLIGVAGSLLMTNIGKIWVGRVRPPLVDAVPPYESSPSFPSGHTLNSTVIAALVAYLVLRKLKSTLARVVTVVLAVVWFVTMGLSRVFLGHHWLTDVAVGWTLGLAWVAAVITAHRLYLTVRRSRREEPTVPLAD
ncbi:MAG TPA: aldo/keto reductase [Propionibacteriaceae bacterium]|nr:aldo/keto reductase [Propionibacteriaceae bacterium]